MLEFGCKCVCVGGEGGGGSTIIVGADGGESCVDTFIGAHNVFWLEITLSIFNTYTGGAVIMTLIVVVILFMRTSALPQLAGGNIVSLTS